MTPEARMLGSLLLLLALAWWVAASIAWGVGGFCITACVYAVLGMIATDDGGTGPF